MGVANETKLEEMRIEKEYIQTQLQTAFQHIESLKVDIQVCCGGTVTVLSIEQACTSNCTRYHFDFKMHACVVKILFTSCAWV